MIRIQGRGIRNAALTYKIVADDAGERVTIRADNAGAPEFWLEVSLGEEDLLAMLAAVRASNPKGSESVILPRKPHPAHADNGVAIVRCYNEAGESIGFVSKFGSYWEGEFRPLRFRSFSEAEAFLIANPQWQPAKIESIDPNVSTSEDGQ